MGFRVRTGWAAAVLLAGPARAPRLLDHRRLQLCDPDVPEARQPYHADFGVARREGVGRARLIRQVERYAARSLAALLREYRGVRRLRGIGLVVASDTDPATIHHPHMRAHAWEGRLYRSVVENAARRHRLRCRVELEAGIQASAARALRTTAARVRRTVAALARGSAGPWRSDEKSAAAAAWRMLVARTGPSSRARKVG